jgi:hypothetical protein
VRPKVFECGIKLGLTVCPQKSGKSKDIRGEWKRLGNCWFI